MKITYIDHMGSDVTVVNAARVSFGKHTTTLRDKDMRLIRYLARHGHWTPFAHVQLQYQVHAPVFVARQWFRHTVGIARNEMSRRYVDWQPELWVPGEWRSRPEDSIKQGSGTAYSDQYAADAVYESAIQRAQIAYANLIEDGVAPEQARAVLPQGTYTTWIETASMYAVARICAQRQDEHAQSEIHELANQLAVIVEPICPVSWGALQGEDT